MTDAQRDFARRELFPYWKGKSLEEAFLARLPEDTRHIGVDTGVLDSDSKWRQAVGRSPRTTRTSSSKRALAASCKRPRPTSPPWTPQTRRPWRKGLLHLHCLDLPGDHRLRQPVRRPGPADGRDRGRPRPGGRAPGDRPKLPPGAGASAGELLRGHPVSVVCPGGGHFVGKPPLPEPRAI